MAVAMVSAQAAPRNRRTLASAAADAKPRSILDNLVLTNKAMLGQIKADAAGALKDPLGTLGNMLKGLFYPFAHPIASARSMIRDIKADPLDGTASTAGTVCSLGWMASVLFAGAAVIAAPFTAGASLALVAPAFAIGNAFFAGVIVADAGGILLHEYRGATARSSGEAIAEGVELASYLEDEALNIVAWAGSNALETRFGRLAAAEAGKAGGRVISETIGVMGVYDLPRFKVPGGAMKAGH